MGKYLSLVKSPVHMVRSTFKNIKRIEFKNNAYYVDDKIDSNFEISKLISYVEDFLKSEYSYNNEKLPDRIDDITHDYLSDKNIEFYDIYYGSELAGFISYKYKNVTDAVSGKPYPDTMHLRMLYVNDKYRRKGLATSALHKMENAAVAHKKKELHTFVHSKNEKALALYYKYGFESEGEATSKKKSDKKKSSESTTLTITMGKESATVITVEL